jgi:predicted TIM-barrel fold metal-dependent hydrolase
MKNENLSRRDFLKLSVSAGVTVGSGLVAAEWSEGQDKMFRKPDWRIIDMHTHLLKRVNPPLQRDKEFRENPLTSHYTWHEYNGDLLIAEMNVAGVKQAIVKSYEPEDIAIALKRFGIPVNQFETGEEYMLPWVRKYPDRFLYAKVYNPTRTDMLPDWKRRIEGSELKAVVLRPPHFPKNPMNGPTYRDIYEWCRANQKPIMITFESIVPPETPTQAEYLAMFKDVVEAYPTIRFALMHTGYDEHAQLSRVPMFRVVNELNEKHGNIWFETAMQDIDYTYPYHMYLEKIHTLYDGVGRDRIMWGTDWPWTDSWCKYFQLVQAVLEHANFLGPDDKRMFLGENAVRFLGLK